MEGHRTCTTLHLHTHTHCNMYMPAHITGELTKKSNNETAEILSVFWSLHSLHLHCT